MKGDTPGMRYGLSLQARRNRYILKPPSKPTQTAGLPLEVQAPFNHQGGLVAVSGRMRLVPGPSGLDGPLYIRIFRFPP